MLRLQVACDHSYQRGGVDAPDAGPLGGREGGPALERGYRWGIGLGDTRYGGKPAQAELAEAAALLVITPSAAGQETDQSGAAAH